MSSPDQDAVQSYLDDLLAESATPVALQDQVQFLEAIKRQQLQALLDRPPPVVLEPAPVQVPVAAPPMAKPTEPEPPQVEVEAVSPLLQWCDNGRPVWAQQKFDALLFRVAGLNLAVPLIALGQIHRLTDELTPIFGQADWFMGLQPTSAGRIRVVNTALFVMPERYDPAFVQSARYVVTIDGLDWGLAVDQVEQPARLSPEDVTWRSERGKRPWLAGTVKTAMCALLDLPQMGRILQSHDRKRAGTAR
ncbi:MAG: chemotaxis protein CheW [Cellvibrionaceae bacterium]|nr:chemotaxis protein CheW [Cellvibrionaceae bacterium]